MEFKKISPIWIVIIMLGAFIAIKPEATTLEIKNYRMYIPMK